MKRAKRVLGFLLAWCMALPLGVAAASPVDETNEVLVLANGSDVTNPQLGYVGSRNDVVWNNPGIAEYDSAYTRMFSQSTKLNVGSGKIRYGTHPTTDIANNYTFEEYGGYGAEHGTLPKGTSYQYINFWVYSPRAFTKEDSSGGDAIPTVTILVNWHNKNSDAGALFATIPVDWEGWKLVSKKISESEEDMRRYDGTPEETSYGWRIAANTGLSGIDEVKWQGSGEHLCIDYVYLSKYAPPEAMAVAGDSAGVRDGKVTYSIVAQKELSSIAAMDTNKISVQKEGGDSVEGVSAEIDESNKNQLNLSMEGLEDGAYTVTLKPGFAYDVYGETLAEETVKKFTVKNGSAVTETFLMTSSDPADGAKRVSIGTKKMTVYFNNPLGAEPSAAITQAGSALAEGDDYTAAAQGNTLTVTMNRELLPETEYKIDLSNLKDIAGQSLSGGKDSVTFTTGKEVTYTIDFEDESTAMWKDHSDTDPLTRGVKEAGGNHYLRISKAGTNQNYIYFPFRGDGEDQVPADGDFTVTYRVYFDTVTAPYNLAISKSGEQSLGLLMKHPRDSKLLRVQHTDDSKTSPSDAQEISLPSDRWHEVCIVYDQSSGRGHLYLDKIDTGYTVYNRGNVSPDRLYFGIDGTYTGSFCIDDIQIYDRQLPPETTEARKPEITADGETVSAWTALGAGADVRTGAALILAQYDEADNLLATELQRMTLKQATDASGANLSHGYGELTVSAERAEGAAKVKALLWNGLDGMAPYTDAASDI